MRLDDPAVVRREFESEELFAARWPFYSSEAREAALAAVADIAPRRVLEVGCGWGDFAERITRELGAEVVAVDVSPRMVELARERGVDARVGDIQELLFQPGEFDCAVAAWMLYHVSNLGLALAELQRVLRPGGRLVAITDGYDHLAELWDMFGQEGRVALSFSRENGESLLRRHFPQVVRLDVETPVVFPDWEAARGYVASTITRRHLAERLPRFDGPLRAHCATAVFVADTNLDPKEAVRLGPAVQVVELDRESAAPLL